MVFVPSWVCGHHAAHGFSFEIEFKPGMVRSVSADLELWDTSEAMCYKSPPRYLLSSFCKAVLSLSTKPCAYPFGYRWTIACLRQNSTNLEVNCAPLSETKVEHRNVTISVQEQRQWLLR
ncbi:unnamed protein product [Dicrocoelium dendriticum]|nr:unnamed protein product [Dicrocoelium dendriticum]